MKAQKNIKERTRENFQKATESTAVFQENAKLKQEISQLQAQLEQARNSSGEIREQSLEQIRSQLENQDGKLKININDIQPSDQCRKTILPIHIQQRSQTLLDNGQRKSLILIPLAEEGKYGLEDGELTWRAASSLVEQGYTDWQYLEAVITPVEEDLDEAHKRSLIHHLHAVHLNSLDKSEALFRELRKSVSLELSDKEIKAGNGSQDVAKNLKFKQIIGRIKNKLPKIPEFQEIYNSLKNKASQERVSALAELNYLSEEERQVLEFFSSWQIENIASFYRKVMPTVFLSDKLKKAVREKGLGCSQAILLNKVIEQKKQTQLITQTLKNNWSESQLKAKINDLSESRNTDNKNYSSVIKVTAKITEETVKSYSPQQRQELINLLENKLNLLKTN